MSKQLIYKLLKRFFIVTIRCIIAQPGCLNKYISIPNEIGLNV